MTDRIAFLKNLESCVNVENVTLQLLVNGSVPRPAATDLMDIVMHHHSYTELFVCGAGEIFIDSQDGPVHLRAGDAALVPTNYMHNRRPGNLDSKWLTIGFTCLRRSSKDCMDLYRRFEKLINASAILTWQGIPGLYGMMESLVGMAAGSNGLLPAMELAQILIRLADGFSADMHSDRQPVQADAADSDIRRMAVLDHLINSCFMNDFSDSEIAQYLYLSERQLSRIVQKWYGSTLRRIITEKRIVTAAQLLRQTDTPTDQIGYSVGFQSKSVFSREFQRLYGVTPAAYRKSQQ